MKTNLKKQHIPPLLAILLAPLLALVAVILRSVSLLTEWDMVTSYFFPEAPFLTAFTTLATVAILLFALFALLARHRLSPAPEENTDLPTLFSSAFLALTLGVCAVYAFVHLSSEANSYSRALLAVLALLALLSLPYFVRFLFWEIRPHRAALLARFGIAPAFFALAGAIYLFFDRTQQMNQPAKLFHLFAFVCVAVFALSECRFLSGQRRPALHYFFLAVGLFMTAAASIPNLIYTMLNTRELVLSTVYDFVLFAYFLYLTARLFQLAPRKARGAHPLTLAIDTRAEDEEVTDGEGEGVAPAAKEPPAPEAVPEAAPEEAETEPKKAPARRPRTKKAAVPAEEK